MITNDNNYWGGGVLATLAFHAEPSGSESGVPVVVASAR
jgi:hypothetical protein